MNGQEPPTSGLSIQSAPCPLDTTSFALAIFVLVAMALTASFVPANRASRAHPLDALASGTE